MTRNEVAERLSSLYEGRGLRSYAYWKTRSDPAYAQVWELLRGRTAPVVDIGCGIGLLAFFLREQGFTAPITGIDFDARKIEAARRAAAHYRDVEFLVGDAREVAFEGDIVLLDMLQYFDRASQQRVLASAARGGQTVIIRQGIGDGSWRHRVTQVVDAIGRIGWNRGERLQFPSREDLTAPFAGDFDAEIRPMWGRTPYNNFLFVFCRKP